MTIVFLKDNWEDSLDFAIKKFEKANSVKPFIYANPKFKEICKWHFTDSEDYDSSMGLYKGYNIEFLDNIDEEQIYLGRKLKVYDEKNS